MSTPVRSLPDSGPGQSGDYFAIDRLVSGVPTAYKMLATRIAYAGMTATFNFAGSLGVGTATPAQRFVVSNGGAEGVEFNPGASANVIISGYYNRSGASFCTNRADASDHIWTIGGTEAARISSAGNMGIGTAPGYKLHVSGVQNANNIAISNSTTGHVMFLGLANATASIYTSDEPLVVYVANAEAVRFDTSRNLLVGVSSSSQHAINKTVAEGSNILTIGNNTVTGVYFQAVANAGFNGGANAAMFIGKNTTTSRSINAAGTINASGADPCEYWRRNALCGTILSGQICGIDAQNELTTTFADAVRFGVKSGLINQPSFIGNDIYGRVHEEAAGPRPVEPGAIDPAPAEPVEPEPFETPEPVQGEDEHEAVFAIRHAQWVTERDAAEAANDAYDAALAAFPAALAAWEAIDATYQAALTAYEAAAAAWDAGLEEERQRWDRISIGGQVYIRTDQPCVAGDYVIPVADGEGIGFSFVAADEVTFEHYRRKVGAVLTTDGEWPLIEVLRS